MDKVKDIKGLKTDNKQHVLKEGWLLKRGAFNKSWKTRYFFLTNRGLYYFEKNSETCKPKGFLDVHNEKSVKKITLRTGPRTRTGEFQIITQNRTWEFCSESDEESEKWVNLIAQVATGSIQKPLTKGKNQTFIETSFFLKYPVQFSFSSFVEVDPQKKIQVQANLEEFYKEFPKTERRVTIRDTVTYIQSGAPQSEIVDDDSSSEGESFPVPEHMSDLPPMEASASLRLKKRTETLVAMQKRQRKESVLNSLRYTLSKSPEKLKLEPVDKLIEYILVLWDWASTLEGELIEKDKVIQLLVSLSPQSFSEQDSQKILDTLSRQVRSSEEESGPSAALQNLISSNDQNPIASNTQNSISSNAQNSISSNAQNSISSNAQKPISSNAQNSISSNAQNSISSNAQNSISSNAQNSISSNAQNSISSNAQKSISSSVENSITSNTVQQRTSPVSSFATQKSQSSTHDNVDIIVGLSGQDILDDILCGQMTEKDAPNEEITNNRNNSLNFPSASPDQHSFRKRRNNLVSADQSTVTIKDNLKD